MKFPTGTSHDWQNIYHQKIVTAEEAASKIRSGDSIYVHSHAAAPASLIEALATRAAQLHDIKLVHIMTLGRAPYASLPDSFNVRSLFVGANVREVVNHGNGDYLPAHLSDIAADFSGDKINLDVCLLQVSAPDEHGNCTYGVSVDCSEAAKKASRLVIAEVNPCMPRTLGQTQIHLSEIDLLVPVNRALPELTSAAPSICERTIGSFVAELVADGATLQLGIGSIPDAVLEELRDKKDLGVHSEMLSDGIVDLVESGAVTNRLKTLHPGKIVVSFVMGSQRLYDFVDDNLQVEFYPSNYVNDPFVVAQNNQMTAINSALQVDLMGQVASASIGQFIYSGFGGQVDFTRGAQRSNGGRAIIAMPSTAKNGELSRISATLAAGTSITLTAADSQFIVTEYGIAELKGKSLKERAKALIQVAHPKFRASLEDEAQKLEWNLKRNAKVLI